LKILIFKREEQDFQVLENYLKYFQQGETNENSQIYM
jgi:hypothetical protein